MNKYERKDIIRILDSVDLKDLNYMLKEHEYYEYSNRIILDLVSRQKTKLEHIIKILNESINEEKINDNTTR